MRDFNHSVNVLVKAYTQGVLLHTDSCGCAAGNLIAEALGIEIIKTPYGAYWGNKSPLWFQTALDIHPTKDGYDQCLASGYDSVEIRRIENAFERQWKINEFGTYQNIRSDEHDPYGFKGLMCVVDVLAEIHNIDLTAKENAKALFVRVE